MVKLWMAAGLVGVAAGVCGGADFYVDPINGSAGGDGSAANPWRSLQDVINAGMVETQGWPSLPYSSGMSLVPRHTGAPIKGGDTIFLRDGDYGDLYVTDHYNTAPITLAAEPGHTPQFHKIRLRASSNWIVQGVEVSNEYGSGSNPGVLIDLDSHGHRGPVRDITIENSYAYSAADTTNWSASDWDSRTANGIQVDGTNMTVRNNHFKNVNFGINVGASHSMIAGNTVENFAGDGMRGLGDYTTYQYNTIKSCYDVNANHDDGFQSWSVGPSGVGTGVVTGGVLRGNTIINYEDPNQPFRGTLQGIGMFDGTFEDWTVENNVVITDHWHGITLYGVNHSTFVNNTIVDINESSPGPPWLSIHAHKNGTLPVGNFIFNNLVTDLRIDNPSGNTAGNNIEFSNPEDWFVDYPKFLLQLKEGVAAIDAGDAAYAPGIDILGVTRPQGAGVDIGAYELPALLLGDMDLNGLVDTADVDEFVQVLQGTLSDPDALLAADCDENGTVDAADIDDFIAILQGAGPRDIDGNANTVPEPATVALLGLGGLALLRRRRA